MCKVQPYSKPQECIPYLDPCEALPTYDIRRHRQLATDKCAQRKVWRMVSQAPILEVLSVWGSWPGKFAFDLPPVWLFPFAVATRIAIGLENGALEYLHTLYMDLKQ